MNPDVLADIERRLKKLEGTTVRYRAGEVSGVGPLDVKLGGSDVAYEDVRTVGRAVTGDQVATLVFGNDLLVLGRIAEAGFAWGTIGAINAGTLKTITHGLGSTPSGVFTQASNSGVAFGVDLVGATTFRIANGSATNTDGYWFAIG